jgi:hypothetical protein
LIWLPIVFKVQTGTDVFFVPNFRFRCFRNTDIVSVSVTVSDFVSNKNMKTVTVLVFSDRFRPFSPLAILATLGMGHLISLAEPTKGLAAWRHDHAHHLRVRGVGHAVLVPRVVASLSSSVTSRVMSPVDLSDLPRA